MQPERTTDALVQNHGTLFLVFPETDGAREWIDEHVTGEVTWFGNALVVEHRYIRDLVAGMIEDGLKVQGES